MLGRQGARVARCWVGCIARSTPSAATQAGAGLSNVRTYFAKDKSKSVYEFGKHRSNAEQRIDEIPVIEVDGDVAICGGGSGSLGHPVEYIQLHNKDPGPVTCKYCGLRYIAKHH